MSNRRQTIDTPQAPAAVGPYAQGIRSGDLLFCSGKLPLIDAIGGDAGERGSR